MPSICFIAQQAYNVLVPDSSVRHIGGAETQQVILARGLAQRGWRVGMVVFDQGQPDNEVVDGVRLIKSYRPGDGVPGLRFLHPRLSGLWSAMRRADADVYYQRGAESETGLVAMWCRRHRRKFVFALAGHHMLIRGFSSQLKGREALLNRYGISRADLILVQTAEQQALLRKSFSLEPHILRNALGRVVHESTSTGPAARDRSGVLWVGRFDPVKRFDWCLDLAELLPDIRFVVVGASNVACPVTRAMEQRAARLGNVTLVGYVPPDRMADYYRSARVLLCTSLSEGFPNTFLEAWSCGTPVVSTVDPDGIVQRRGLGSVAGTIAAVGDALRGCERDHSRWCTYSANGLKYVRQYHDADAVVDQLHGYLDALTHGGATGNVLMRERLLPDV
jgi:glycosyltransferase involved in cell wall biosynthesis